MRALAILVLLFALSCHEAQKPGTPSPAQSARDYNNRVVAVFDTLARSRATVSDAIREKNSLAAQKAIRELQHTAQRLTDSLRTMPEYKGNSSLRDAAVGLFIAYAAEIPEMQSALPIIYTDDAIDTLLYPDSIAPPDSLDPHDPLIAAYAHIFRGEKKCREAYNKFVQAQKDFSDRYGFSLALKPEEESR